MQLSQLRIFLKVVETGSFSRAGAALSLAQPAISRTIRQLEEENDAKLFHRHGRGVLPTEAGERFAYHSAEIMRHARELQSELSNLQGTLQGSAHVAVPPGVGKVIMVPLVRRFKQHHPAATLRVTEVFTGDIPERLANGTIDVGLTYSSLVMGSAQRDVLVNEDIHLIGPAGAEGTRTGEITMANAARLPLILPTRRGGLRGDIDTALLRSGTELNIVLEVDATGPLISLVREGIGYTVLPLCSLYDERMSDFSLARITNPSIQRELSLCTSTAHPLTAVAREASRILREQIFEFCGAGGWTKRRPANAN